MSLNYLCEKCHKQKHKDNNKLCVNCYKEWTEYAKSFYASDIDWNKTFEKWLLKGDKEKVNFT